MRAGAEECRAFVDCLDTTHIPEKLGLPKHDKTQMYAGSKAEIPFSYIRRSSAVQYHIDDVYRSLLFSKSARYMERSAQELNQCVGVDRPQRVIVMFAREE